MADKTLFPYTVLYTEPGNILWLGFNCMAENEDHAEEQCESAYPDATVAWVNEGHNNMDCSFEPVRAT